MPPQMGRVFAPFWSPQNRYKLLPNFGLDSGMFFEGTTGVYERVQNHMGFQKPF